MTIKIVADAEIPYVSDFFAGRGELYLTHGREIKQQMLSDANILLVRSVTQVNRKLLANSPLKFIGSVTAGMDHVDTSYLSQSGIAWCSAAGFNAQAVADYVVGIIATCHQHHKLSIKAGLRAAVIGVGHVGSKVAAYLKSLGFTVYTCDPLRAKQDANFLHTPIENLAHMDLISFHVPLTYPTSATSQTFHTNSYPTYHLLTQAILEKQKPNCVIINSSRGAVIDTQVILNKRHQAITWCLDVFENEPVVNKTVLARAFIATPHIAGYTKQSKIRGITMIYQYALSQGFLKDTAKATTPAFLPKKLHGKTNMNFKENWQKKILNVFDWYQYSQFVKATLLAQSNPQSLGLTFDALRRDFPARDELFY